LEEGMKKKPLTIGTKIRGYGTIEAIAWLGERYYFLINKYGVVSMIPEFILLGKPKKGAK
jgi:hypothetical protein